MSPMAPRKRKRIAAQEPGEDLISHLERDCLLHILSFLDTRASVRTSVLSRSWRNLWSLVPALDLSCPFPSFPADAPAHHVLDLEGQRQIWRFRLFVNYTMHDEQWQLARRWVRHALQRRPSHVELVCNASDPSGELLPLVFSCTSMESLYLHHRVDHLPHSFQFARLKTLHIYDIRSNYDVLQQLILSSPDLEELHVVRCLYRSLNILNPGLKRLLIHGATYNYPERNYQVLLNITAPELEWLSLHFTSVPEMLTIQGSAPSLCFFNCIATLSVDFDLALVSLIRASVRFDGRSSRYLPGWRIPILQGLNGVQVLRLPYATLMVLSVVKHLPRDLLFPYQNLKYLELETHLNQYDIRVLTLLLRSCSNLETFIIKVAEVQRSQVQYGLGRDWELQDLYDECSFYHLKTIRIHGFDGGLHGMEFMEFLLGRASNLQTVYLIYNKRSRHLRMANQFVEVLKTFLQAATAEVIFLTET